MVPVLHLPNGEVNPETDKTSKISISVKDDYYNPVAGARVTLSSGNNEYSTGETGTAGGATINNVPYGTYSVNITLPSGDDYGLLSSYDDVIVSEENTSVALTVHRATMYEEYGD